MRVILSGQPGELVVNESEILHFMDGSRVQKFYQQMMATFVPDNGNNVSWAVSNWGPGVENSPHSNLKGGIKVVAYNSPMAARQANNQQIRIKTNKGYQHSSDFGGGCVAPTHKLMDAIDARPDYNNTGPSPTSRPAKAKEFKVERQEADEAIYNGNSMTNLQTSVSELAKITLRALARDDIPSAITSRRSLIELITEVNSLQENAAGQLEILNAKLSEALR